MVHPPLLPPAVLRLSGAASSARRSKERTRLARIAQQLLGVVLPAPVEAADQLRIEAIPGCTFGAVVHGVNLLEPEMDPAVFQRIEAAFLEHAALFFPGQVGLTKEQQTAFLQRFGPIDPNAENLIFSNVRKNGDFIAADSVGWDLMNQTQGWHTDQTYMAVSVKVGSIFAEKVPASGGGETEFADMRAGYDSLSPEMQKKIDSLTSYHSSEYSLARRTGKIPGAPKEDGKGFFEASGGASVEKNNFALHGDAILRPLVKVHPETKRKALFVTMHSFAVPGMSRQESYDFLEDLIAQACQKPRTYAHQWQVGDLGIWDQRCILHRARPFRADEARRIRAMRVSGSADSESGLPAPEGKQVLASELEELGKVPIFEKVIKESHFFV